jgi:hypothetical protein
MMRYVKKTCIFPGLLVGDRISVINKTPAMHTGFFLLAVFFSLHVSHRLAAAMVSFALSTAVQSPFFRSA